LRLAAQLVAMMLACCGGAAPLASDARYPARPEGCAVKVFHGSPSMPAYNIGAVHARCAFDVSDADCLRTLEDQVCKLGGDIVWGVPDKPGVFGEKNVWDARAAHTKREEPAAAESSY